MSWFCTRNPPEFVILLLYNVGLLSNKNEVINADSFLTSKPWDNASWVWILNLFPTFPRLPRLWLSNPESLQKQQILYFWWSDPQSPVNIAKVHSHYRKERQQQTITTTSKVPDLDGATIIAVPPGFRAFFKHSNNWGRPSSKNKQSALMITSYCSFKSLAPLAHLIHWN